MSGTPTVTYFRSDGWLGLAGNGIWLFTDARPDDPIAGTSYSLVCRGGELHELVAAFTARADLAYALVGADEVTRVVVRGPVRVELATPGRPAIFTGDPDGGEWAGHVVTDPVLAVTFAPSGVSAPPLVPLPPPAVNSSPTAAQPATAVEPAPVAVPAKPSLTAVATAEPDGLAVPAPIAARLVLADPAPAQPVAGGSGGGAASTDPSVELSVDLDADRSAEPAGEAPGRQSTEDPDPDPHEGAGAAGGMTAAQALLGRLIADVSWAEELGRAETTRLPPPPAPPPLEVPRDLLDYEPPASEEIPPAVPPEAGAAVPPGVPLEVPPAAVSGWFGSTREDPQPGGGDHAPPTSAAGHTGPPPVPRERPVPLTQDNLDVTVWRPIAASAMMAANPLVVSAVRCVDGHLNPLSANSCRVCAKPVPPQEAAVVTRPPLGVLRLSTSDTIRLDHGVVFGRDPGTPDGSRHDEPYLVMLSDRDISRRHLEIVLDGWDVVAIDLNSSNGSAITVPGGVPEVIPGGARRLLVPGTTVHLSDTVWFVYEVTP